MLSISDRCGSPRRSRAASAPRTKWSGSAKARSNRGDLRAGAVLTSVQPSATLKAVHRPGEWSGRSHRCSRSELRKPISAATSSAEASLPQAERSVSYRLTFSGSSGQSGLKNLPGATALISTCDESEFKRKKTGKRGNGRLGNGVGERGGRRCGQSRGRRDEHNAAASGSLHERQKCLDGEDDRCEVDVEDVPPLVVIQIAQPSRFRPGAFSRNSVRQHQRRRARPNRFRKRRDGCLDLRGRRDIGCDQREICTKRG